MKEIGELLKRTRIEKGMTLQEIANITKISVRYLDGIEKGDWSLMPGPFYVKGFVRSYAKVLEIDVSPLLAELNRGEEDKLTTSPVMATTSRPVRAYRFGKLFSTSLVMILIAVIFFAIFYYVSNSEPDDIPPPSDGEQVEQGNQDPVIPDLEPLPEKEVTPEDEVQAPETETEIVMVEPYVYEIKNATELRIKLEATAGSCWFDARAGSRQGDVLDTKTVRQGEIYEFTVNESISLRLGNLRAVNLYVNDQLIEKESIGEARNFQLQIVNQ